MKLIIYTCEHECVCALRMCVVVDVFDILFMNRHVHGCVHVSLDCSAKTCQHVEAMSRT